MFTAARLVAALCLAALGFFGSEYIMQIMPESTNFGNFLYVNIVIGFFCGWMIAGPRAGRGMSAAISHGITATVSLILWALLVQSVNEMVKLAMRHRYDGPVEAFGAIFEIGIDFGGNLLDTGFIMLMVIGALVTGILSETASKYWR